MKPLRQWERERAGQRLFYVFTGTTCEASSPSHAEAMDSARRHARYRKQRARVVLITMAPDGRWPTTPPWPGGTWSGRCGSTRWSLDLDDRLECGQRMRHLGPCWNSAFPGSPWDPWESIRYVPDTLPLTC